MQRLNVLQENGVKLSINNTIIELELFKVRNFDEVMIDYRTIGDTEIPVVVVDDFSNGKIE